MPRFEVAFNLTSEMACTSAEVAAAIIRRQVTEGAAGPNQLQHIAVWREEPGETLPPVDPVIRNTLVDIFSTLEHSATEAEETFRGQFEAILLGPSIPADPSSLERASRPDRAQNPEDRESS